LPKTFTKNFANYKWNKTNWFNVLKTFL